jgi:hypothetical protein
MADAIMVDSHLLGMLRCEPRVALARVERCLLESIASDSRSIKSSCLPGGPKPRLESAFRRQPGTTGGKSLLITLGSYFGLTSENR